MHRSEMTFDQKEFAQLRPISIVCLVVMTLACLLVLVLVDNAYQFSPWLYAWIPAAATSCYAAYRCKTTISLLFTAMCAVAIGSACLGAVATIINNSNAWFLPIGLILSLPGAAVYYRPLCFVGSCALVWSILFYQIQPSFGQQLDWILTLLTISFATLIGAAVCEAFCRARRQVFDLQQQLHEMAYQDTLTGLPNRRAFMDRLSQAVDESEAAAEPLYFLMLDIDNFKSINDSLGHDFGDLVLIEVAKVLRERCQKQNFARLGGEEFAVVARFANIAAAQQYAQGIVDAVHSSRAYDLSLSISIGLAEREAGETTGSLMQRADLALYQAKRTGKNRYALAEKALQD